MKTLTVKTGFGYIQDKSGRIIVKAKLPIGEHPLRDDYDYVEVVDSAALEAVQVYVDPADQAKIETERKIAAKTRELSIKALIADGQLPANYKD